MTKNPEKRQTHNVYSCPNTAYTNVNIRSDLKRRIDSSSTQLTFQAVEQIEKVCIPFFSEKRKFSL